MKRASPKGKASWKTEDEAFLTDTDWEGLLPIAKSIGSSQPLTQSGDFHLLNPVRPIRLKEFPFSKKEREELQEAIQARQAEIEKIADAEIREAAYAALNDSQNRLILGASLSDRLVNYNPNPFSLFGNVFGEIARNLTALFSGSLGPKQFGGPIFIVQVMQQSWGLGIKEALFWLGAISLNLGVLNLLPIPVLDGGHICFSLLEKIRKKPLKAKTMQRLIIPFVALLIFVFIYLTYNDLTRIFGRFF